MSGIVWLLPRIVYAISTMAAVWLAAYCFETGEVVTFLAVVITGTSTFVFSLTRKGIAGVIHIESLRIGLRIYFWLSLLLVGGLVLPMLADVEGIITVPPMLMLEIFKIAYYMIFWLFMAIMIFCYLGAAFKYIKYIHAKKPEDIELTVVSNTGFLCLRDMTPSFLLPFYLSRFFNNQFVFYTIVICWIIGSIVNNTLFFIAREKHGVWEFIRAQDGSVEPIACSHFLETNSDKPALVSADILNADSEFLEDDLYWSLRNIYIPEFAIDQSRGSVSVNCARTENDYYSICNSNRFEIINAFSYADACRQLLGQECGKDGIVFLTRDALQIWKLRAILEPEELKKITFLSVKYTGLFGYANNSWMLDNLMSAMACDY